MPFNLDEESWSAFMRGIVRGSYYLLLGAGASRGGTDSFGDPPPLGFELADDLIDEFELPAAPGELDLTRAFEAAMRRGRGRNYASVDTYLHERFTGCTSPDWFSALPLLRWRRIYTLNIDDTLDHAYVEAREARAQQARITHWSHPYFDVDSARQVAIVHLHGRARLLGDDHENNLVFGLDQYYDATATNHAWHRIFGDTFQKEPFLVIGATLSQEIDLAQILRRGNSSSSFSGYPSLVVLPSIDPIRRDELTDYGLVPVETTGKELFAQIAHDAPQFVEETPIAGGGLPTAEAIRFLTQFRRLELVEEEERDRRHDIYAGHEPTWQDIVRERDVPLEQSRRAAHIAARGLLRETSHRVICLHGGPFTGKSTALLRAARELIAAGSEVYLFRATEQIDLDALDWWIQRSGPMALVVDGLADFGADLADLAERFDLDAVQLIVLGAERTGRVGGLGARLPAGRFVAGDNLELATLTDEDINALIAKLREAGRLGRITQRNRGGQIVYFRTEHHRELFPAMAGLERAPGFATRLRDLSDALTRRELRTAYAACALVHSVGYGTPPALAASASGLQVRDLVRAATDNKAFADLVVVHEDTLRTRQRALASLFVDQVLESRERFDLTGSLATLIAPHVTRATISQRTLHARIAGQLMDERNVRRWVGAVRVEEWYDEQAEHHDWNARFWEQRALAATQSRAWDRAESYAERAVSILADPFTLNTLGTTLLRKAVAETAPGSDVREDYYRRAVSALMESRREGRGRFMHPYVTLFEYTLRLARSDRTRAGRVPPLYVQTWNDWLLLARASPVFVEQELREQLEGYVTEWLLLIR